MKGIDEPKQMSVFLLLIFVSLLMRSGLSDRPILKVVYRRVSN